MSLTVAILTLPLAACDREAPEEAQQQGELAGAKAGLAGELDRSSAGELMPATIVVDPDGNELNLAALQGQPVLLNLWATWCAPCVVEMPMLDELAGEYGDALRVVTVSQDRRGAEKVVPFFAKQDFQHLQPWMDATSSLDFEISGGVLPATVLYDASGQEVWRVVGEYDWSSADARVAIAEAVE
uniref:TlpA family protein disulfide reductase n=1 Tax=Parerythrobacter lutipelagi TaxID=1964208 RepID=UPI0010F91263|nr:TlpA disulfide reductase family protein [Parerythrobacter lutipelagi]